MAGAYVRRSFGERSIVRSTDQTVLFLVLEINQSSWRESTQVFFSPLNIIFIWFLQVSQWWWMSFYPEGLNSIHCDSKSLTVSTQQASLYPHTECVPFYLFTHFHVAKRCHFDELDLEQANCFHSTGQVSYALDLNILRRERALPFPFFIEASMREPVILADTGSATWFPWSFSN